MSTKADLVKAAELILESLRRGASSDVAHLRIGKPNKTETGGWSIVIGSIKSKKLRIEVWLDKWLGAQTTVLWAGFVAWKIPDLELFLEEAVYDVLPNKVLDDNDYETKQRRHLALKVQPTTSELKNPFVEKYLSTRTAFYGIYGTPKEPIDVSKAAMFVDSVTTKLANKEKRLSRKTGGAASSPYIRYIQENEIEINPRHNELQTLFENSVRSAGGFDLKPNCDGVDLLYIDRDHGKIMSEIKPCVVSNARYAIRSAIGQLLDYNQRQGPYDGLLIVLDCEPNSKDKALALENGFGIAFPKGKSFNFKWPSGFRRDLPISK